MTIIDKRHEKTNTSAKNRQKFIERYKSYIERQISEQLENISDIDKKKEIKVKFRYIHEPIFTHEQGTGDFDFIATGNKKYYRGDEIYNDEDEEQGSGNQSGEDGTGEFSITLSKKEWLRILFKNMELPNFDKESLKKDVKTKYQRAGYSKYGIPARLDIKKTFENRFKRIICSKEENPAYLDDIDIRYKRIDKKQEPALHATIIYILDVSGSMSDELRNIAKKFFMILYLFIKKTYKYVDMKFIIHTEDAYEVDEKEFFSSQKSGGTRLSSSLKLIEKDIKKISSNSNVYIAQATDGDNFYDDTEIYIKKLLKMLPHLQFYCYLETINYERSLFSTSRSTYRNIPTHDKIGKAQITQESDVLPILQKLFKKRGSKQC